MTVEVLINMGAVLFEYIEPYGFCSSRNFKASNECK